VDYPAKKSQVNYSTRWFCYEFMIHIDAGVGRHCGRGAIAAICHDALGLFLGKSANSIPDLVSPEIVEAMASDEALSLAMNLSCCRIVVATDCIATAYHLKG
jgi:hypothetical protein